MKVRLPGRMWNGRAVWLLCAAAASLCFLGLRVEPAGAAKLRAFEEVFGSVAQPGFAQDRGLAIDQSTGDLLVIDAGAKTVGRFKSNGEADPFPALGSNVIDGKPGPGGKPCAEEPASCDVTETMPSAGIVGAFAGAREVQIAVAPSGSASGTAGNIYITNAQKHLVDIFAADGHYLGQLTKYTDGSSGEKPLGESCGVTVDSSGAVYVGDFGGLLPGQIHKFVPSANPPVNTDSTINLPFSKACTLAAGVGPTAGSIFATHYGGSVEKIDSADGESSYVVSSGANTTVTVDPVSGHVFAATGAEIREYDASSEFRAELFAKAKPGSTVEGIAIRGAADKLLVANASVADVGVFGAAVPFLPYPATDTASEIRKASARLNGAINPDGIGLSECFFEYGTTTAYGQTVPCIETPAGIGSGTGQVAVHADIAGLSQATDYHFRLGAANVNGTEVGEDESFKTLSPPIIVDQWVVGALTEEATLKARIDPEGAQTTFRIEYGPDTSYGQNSSEVGVGGDKTDHTIGVNLNDLEPGETYHWRVVATSEVGVALGPDLVFNTYPLFAPQGDCSNQVFRKGASASLPNCRAYEMVSPIDKNGAGIETGVAPGSDSSLTPDALNVVRAALDQSSVEGTGLTYSSKQSFGDAISGPFSSQYLARRDPSRGWLNHGISPPRKDFPTLERQALDAEFKAFSEDLSQGWLMYDAELSLDPCASTGSPVLYRRSNVNDAYEALHCEPNQEKKSSNAIELQGVSADGCRAVFRSNSKLTADAAATGPYQLYESSCEGPLRLVSLLPGVGGPCQQDSTAGSDYGGQPGGRTKSVYHAFSADARRLYWSCGQSLYLRSDPEPAVAGEVGEEVVKVAGPVLGTPPRFQTAASDGSRVLFTGLTVPGFTQSLQVFEATGKTTSTIATELENSAGQALDLLGAGEDATRAYFVSVEMLSEDENSEGDKAVAGQPNLYLYEAGAGLRFVGVLSVVDDLKRAGTVPSPIHPQRFRRASRVSADGLRAAFISASPLTGYDNTDIDSGEADAEVFVFDASARGGAGQIFCVSCNPSEARPDGRNIGESEDENKDNRLWAAARIPGWQTQLYPGRALSEDGSRLFFTSFEGLVPRDTNGRQDVYAWERAGDEEGCKALGAELFVSAAGGCLSLISSGRGTEHSEFVDADRDGSDVFIRTGESLLPHDPGLLDIYDARVGGGLPSPPPRQPECEGEACQSPPAPPVFPGSASSSYSGPGDPEADGGRKPGCPKGKRRIRRKGKTHCVAKHQRKRPAQRTHRGSTR